MDASEDPFELVAMQDWEQLALLYGPEGDDLFQSRCAPQAACCCPGAGSACTPARRQAWLSSAVAPILLSLHTGAHGHACGLL